MSIKFSTKGRCVHCLLLPVGKKRKTMYAIHKPYCSQYCKDLAAKGIPSPHGLKRIPKRR